MNTTQPERAYVIEYTENGNPDQECGGMPFHLSVTAKNEDQARERFAEHMRTQHPDAEVTIQHVELPVFPDRRPDIVAQGGRC